jgi:hypothetical protein
MSHQEITAILEQYPIGGVMGNDRISQGSRGSVSLPCIRRKRGISQQYFEISRSVIQSIEISSAEALHPFVSATQEHHPFYRGQSS